MKEKLVFTRDYAAEASAVWEALTNREALSEWLLTGEFHPEKGTRFQFSGDGTKISGVVLECRPLEKLSYTWNSKRDDEDDSAGTASVVTWTLTPSPTQGTRVVLEHDFTMAAQPVLVIESSINWTFALNSSIAAYLMKRGCSTPIVYALPNEQSPERLDRAGFRQPEEAIR